MRILPLMLLAVACDPGGDGKDPDGNVHQDDTGSGSMVFVDEDKDGHLAGDDCDDNDYRVYPGAEEVCDGKDNDCNGETDEGFDLDGDGALDMEQCGDIGTDCDESNPEIPAEEIPYDGIDQDCSGSDLIDVDGDGYPGLAGGGNDCNDEDATVHPSAPEVARDGIDQDCNGVDLIDGDGDGFEAVSHGGDDCDDDDEGIHPGAIDWTGDGVDSDCDGVDGGLFDAANAPVMIAGNGGENDRAGHDIAICDLDSDGLLDLVVTAPYAGDYNGAVGVFYGRNADTWTSDMVLEDAGTIVLSEATAWGFGAACADVNGDGMDDLVVGQGEVQFGPFVSDYTVHIIYGMGGMMPGVLDDQDADASIVIDLGAPGGVGDIQAGKLTVSDLSGDGAAEIIVDHDEGGTEFGSAAVWIIPGNDYWGTYDMETVVIAVLADEQGDTVTALAGNGHTFAIGQGDYRPGMSPGEDSIETFDKSGKVAIVGLVGGEFDSIGEAADLEITADGVAEFGRALGFGDIDNDGSVDLAVGAPAAGGGAGIVYFFSDIDDLADAGGSDVGADATAAYTVIGTSGLGVGLALGGDMTGDGVPDALLAEAGADGVGAVWVISGARLEPGENVLADVAVLGIRGQYSSEQIGHTLAVADLDGDGIDDIIVGSSHHPSPAPVGLALSGRVSVFLSSRR
jgi:hypothetical protein